MKTKRIIFTILISTSISVGYAQMDSTSYRKKFDSIMAMPTDTNQVRALNELAWEGKYVNLPITEEVTDVSLQIAKSKGYTEELAFVYKMKGILNDEQGLYAEAIQQYLLAIKEYEKIPDSMGVAKCEANIGMIYRNMKKQNEAIPYFRKSAGVFNQYNFYYGIQLCYTNIGICHMDLGALDSAEIYFQSALDIMHKTGDVDPSVYGNMGLLYSLTDRKQEAKEYLEKCIALIEADSPDNQNLKVWYQNLGVVYLDFGQVDQAIEMLEKAKNMSGTNTFTREMTYLLKSLSRAYEAKGDFKEALAYYKQLVVVNDSIYTTDNLAQINDVKARYESEKQELLIESLNKEKEIESAKRSQEEAKVKYMTIGAFLLGIILLAFVFGFISKVKANKKISEQNVQIESQRMSLQAKNEEILSSIEYAKRIQTAILPPDKIVKEYLNESFIFYRPKDIVAGDFYWMERQNDKLLFAVADCTGHGVPGALVSVVCHNALNRSVREFGLHKPGEILDKTRELVTEQFSKSEENVRDGMDIALVSLRFEENGTTTLEYAGANNPLWIVRKNKLEELKPTKQPIGKYENMSAFETHTTVIDQGDSIYLFSDGYSDQFGGASGKKFKSGALRKLLVEMSHKTMAEQRKSIENVFDSWKGELEQIDDICIIGVKL